MSVSAASIRAKLEQMAKLEGIAFQVIIFRFLHERFLFRLSISPFKNQFFLKGGAFLYSVEETKTRPTKDLDFLAQSIQNDLVEIQKAFKRICELEYSKIPFGLIQALLKRKELQSRINMKAFGFIWKVGLIASSKNCK